MITPLTLNLSVTELDPVTADTRLKGEHVVSTRTKTEVGPRHEPDNGDLFNLWLLSLTKFPSLPSVISLRHYFKVLQFRFSLESLMEKMDRVNISYFKSRSVQLTENSGMPWPRS